MNISPLVHAISCWWCFWVWKLFKSFWVAIIPFLNTCCAGVLSPRPNSSLWTPPQNQNCSSWCQSLNCRRLNVPQAPTSTLTKSYIPGSQQLFPICPRIHMATIHNPVSTVSPKGSNLPQQCDKSYPLWTELLILFSPFTGSCKTQLNFQCPSSNCVASQQAICKLSSSLIPLYFCYFSFIPSPSS